MRFLLDTNVYLSALADERVRGDFERFALDHDVEVVSSVVIAEILLGAVRATSRPALAHSLTLGTPALAPEHADWELAARAVSRLEKPGGKSRSFWNDALLAAQCARLDSVLVTSNTADFKRLQREIPVQIVMPFPA